MKRKILIVEDNVALSQLQRTGLNVAAMLSQPPWMNLRQKEY